jgi:L-fucose mutarotase/ribose pyranase (RbsD/FucU family)
MGKNSIVIRCDGHGVPELLDAILQVFPLDTYVDKPVNLMEVMPGDTVETPIWDTYKEIITKYDSRGAKAVGNIERFKQGKSAFTINDAKDSGNTVQDCNIMIALYNPHRDGLKTYKNYDIKQLESNFRSIMCLKNRFGDCDVEVGCNFFGGMNIFHELPKPDEIYDYARYTNPNYLLEESQLDNSIEIDNEFSVDKQNSNFNYIL